jgi:hypothetical protein
VGGTSSESCPLTGFDISSILLPQCQWFLSPELNNVIKILGVSRATVSLFYLISGIRKVSLTYILFVLFGLLNRRNFRSRDHYGVREIGSVDLNRFRIDSKSELISVPATCRSRFVFLDFIT